MFCLVVLKVFSFLVIGPLFPLQILLTFTPVNPGDKYLRENQGKVHSFLFNLRFLHFSVIYLFFANGPFCAMLIFLSYQSNITIILLPNISIYYNQSIYSLLSPLNSFPIKDTVLEKEVISLNFWDENLILCFINKIYVLTHGSGLNDKLCLSINAFKTNLTWA